MATIVNNPGTSREGSGAGLVVGLIVAIVLVALLVIYGLPFLRGTANNAGTTINVPDKVDVNVQGVNPSAQ